MTLGGGGGDPGLGLRVAARLRRVPATVWVATVALGAVLVLWSLLTPAGRAPDEFTHADLVFHLAEQPSYPDFDERMVGAAAGDLHLRQQLQSRGQRLTVAGARPATERPTFDEMGGDEPSAWRLPNQMPQHPPFYYYSAAAVVRVERAVVPGELSFGREWLLVRLFGAALVLPLPLLAWWAATALGVGAVAARAASLFPLAVPQLAHIGASVSNDSLLTLLGALLAVAGARVLSGDASRRTAVVAGVIGGLALLTKALALFLVMALLVAYAVAAVRRTAPRRKVVRAAVLAGAVSSAVGGWWWVRNLVRHGTPAPTITDQFFLARPGFEPDTGWWVGRAAVWLPQRFWGTFDWLTVPLAAPVVVGASALAVVAVLAALAPGRWSRSDEASPGRVRLAALLTGVLLLLGFVLQHAWEIYARSGHPQFLQGRYLFGALVPIAVVVAVGATRLLGRWAPVAVLGWALVMVVDGFRVALAAWWGPPGSSVRGALRAADAWNPLVDQAVWGVLALTLVAGLGLAVTVGRDLLRPPSGRAADGVEGG